MSWSKQDLIKQAFEQLGLASYVFDLSAEQLQSALKTLDNMMATWNGEGIRVGYPIPSTANGSSLEDDSCIVDKANEAVVMNLAMRLGPSVGKDVGPTVLRAAKKGYDVLLAQAAIPGRMRLPHSMPSGAGQKPWRGPERPYIDDANNTIATGPDGQLDILFDSTATNSNDE